MWTVESIKVNSTQTRHRSSRAAKTRKENMDRTRDTDKRKEKRCLGAYLSGVHWLMGGARIPGKWRLRSSLVDKTTWRHDTEAARLDAPCRRVCVWGRYRNKMTRRGWSEEQNALQERGGDNRSITYGFQKGMVDLSRLGRWHDEARDQKMRKSGLWLHAYCGRWEEKFYHRY